MWFRRRPRPTPLFFLARQQGLAYLQMPKVACTTFKVALAVLNQPELAEPLALKPMLIHIRPEWNDPVAANDQALAGLFRFTFVRHPVRRLVSMYWDKLVNPRDPEVWPSLTAMGLKRGMSLAQVMDVVEKTDFAEMDPHILPQSVLAYDGDRLRVDYLGQVERIEEGMQEIATRIGRPLAIGHHNQKRSAPPPPASSAEDLARIERFYAEDFRRFGYQREYA